MSYLEIFGVLTGVRVDFSKIFGVGAGAGVLKREAGAEPESEKYDSAHLWPELMIDQFIQENRANILIYQLAFQRKFKFNKINCLTPIKTEILTPAPAPGPVFIQKSDSRSCSGFGKNRRLLPESTTASWSALLSCRDEQGSGLDRTVIILKIGVSG